MPDEVGPAVGVDHSDIPDTVCELDLIADDGPVPAVGGGDIVHGGGPRLSGDLGAILVGDCHSDRGVVDELVEDGVLEPLELENVSIGDEDGHCIHLLGFGSPVSAG